MAVLTKAVPLDTFELRTGLTYPTDASVDACLVELREALAAARQQAASTGDPRDADAAMTAAKALEDATRNALADGTLKRAEAGEVVSDLPAKSLGWLLEQGLIVRVSVDPVAALGKVVDEMRSAGLLPKPQAKG